METTVEPTVKKGTEEKVIDLLSTIVLTQRKSENWKKPELGELDGTHLHLFAAMIKKGIITKVGYALYHANFIKVSDEVKDKVIEAYIDYREAFYETTRRKQRREEKELLKELKHIDKVERAETERLHNEFVENSKKAEEARKAKEAQTEKHFEENGTQVVKEGDNVTTVSPPELVEEAPKAKGIVEEITKEEPVAAKEHHAKVKMKLPEPKKVDDTESITISLADGTTAKTEVKEQPKEVKEQPEEDLRLIERKEMPKRRNRSRKPHLITRSYTYKLFGFIPVWSVSKVERVE